MSEVLDRFSLEGRVAVVTGASRGIGLAVATAFAEAGAVVYGVGRSFSDRTSKCKRFSQIVLDIRDRDALEDFRTQIQRSHNAVDVLVNAAGVSVAIDVLSDGSEAFDEIIDVNLKATFRLTELLYPLFSSRSSIINIGSLASVFGFSKNPGYVASKSGLEGLTRSMAMDLAGNGTRVNCIVPGYIATDMTTQSQTDAELSRQRVQRTMLGRWGHPADIVGPVIFLASDASEYVTGATIRVDGGWSARGI